MILWQFSFFYPAQTLLHGHPRNGFWNNFWCNFFCSRSHSITLWARAVVTCFNTLSQRFGIFDLVDLVKNNDSWMENCYLWIYFPFSFSFFSCFTGGAIKGSCPGIKWQAQQWTTLFRAAGAYRDVGTVSSQPLLSALPNWLKPVYWWFG